MKSETLIRMANQIAQFFEPYPHDEALAGVADHIKKFWDPRMRTDFFAALDKGEGGGLHPLALEAAAKLRDKGATTH
jgi:formate dehydrogenase subunit delta